MLWNERFAFGIDVIDEQHKHLFDLMEEVNNLIKDVEDGIDCYDEIEHVLEELESYTVYHFSEEEKMLEEMAYPEFEKHKMEHDGFVAKVHETLNDEDIDFKQEGVLLDLSTFLLDWVSNHILLTDIHYVAKMKAGKN